jgi:hypothetical protein
MRSIGNRPAFPFTYDNTNISDFVPHTGMSYRHWLISQIAGANVGSTGKQVIERADEIIKLLDEEQEDKKSDE